MFWHSRAFHQVFANPGVLAVGGLVDRPTLGLTREDLAALPREFQVTDVAAYAKVPCADGAKLVGVRLAAILQHVAMHPESMFVNLATRAGFRVSLFRREIESTAFVIYGRGHGPLAAVDGGPFRFLLPGKHDEARDLADLGVIEFSSSYGVDMRADGGVPPARPGAAGDLPWLKRSRPAAHENRTIVMPPPTT